MGWNGKKNMSREEVERAVRGVSTLAVESGMSATDVASIARDVSREKRKTTRRDVEIRQGEVLVITGVGEPPPGKVLQLCVGKERGTVTVWVRYATSISESREEP